MGQNSRKIIPYGKQSITQDDIDAVVEALMSDFLTQGPKVKEFEEAFASFVGSKYAVAVNSGTAALHLSALALGIQKGDNVITTPITFAASANAVLYCGGNVFFCDINPETWTIDAKKIEELINAHPKGFFKGIIPVDFAGLAVNMEEIGNIAKKHGLWIIEDACHAPGAFFVDSSGKNQLCGNGLFSDLSVFSFHPVKHITTAEGGMITTNNKHLYERLLLYRTHGITKNPEQLMELHGGWYYEMHELGFNYRIPDLLCALGINQLKKLPYFIKRRKEIAKRYNEAFKQNKNIHIQNPELQNGHIFHLYIILTNKRKELYDFLRQKNIYTQVHYLPVYRHPFYRKRMAEKIYCLNSENFYNTCLSLPIYPDLSDEEQDYVISCVKEFFQQYE